MRKIKVDFGNAKQTNEIKIESLFLLFFLCNKRSLCFLFLS